MATKRKGMPARFVEDETETEVYDPDEIPAPITDNAIEVPLFADSDGRSTRSLSRLRLYKVEPGGPPAYKGEIPLSSTLETIGQMFGDGI